MEKIFRVSASPREIQEFEFLKPIYFGLEPHILPGSNVIVYPIGIDSEKYARLLADYLEKQDRLVQQADLFITKSGKLDGFNKALYEDRHNLFVDSHYNAETDKILEENMQNEDIKKAIKSAWYIWPYPIPADLHRYNENNKFANGLYKPLNGKSKIISPPSLTNDW